MIKGMRYVFFSLTLSLVSIGIVLLLVSDDLSNLFSRTPKSSNPTPSDDDKEKDVHVTRAPEPDKIPIVKDSKDTNSEPEQTAESIDTKTPDVKPDTNYLRKDQWEKYRKIREESSNLLERFNFGKKNFSVNKNNRYLIQVLDVKSLEAAISASLDELSTGYERSKMMEALNRSYNRDIVDKMLELLMSSDAKLKEIAYDYFYCNVFPELGDVIVKHLVENPDYKLWFSCKSEFCRISSIFQIFSYYADQKTYPLFLKAYNDNLDSLKDTEGSCIFNSFFAGVSSHAPFDKRPEELTLKDWQQFYETYQADIVELKRTDEGQIVTMTPTGNIAAYHEKFRKSMFNKGFYIRFPLISRMTDNPEKMYEDEYYPTHLTYVPIVLETLNSAIADPFDTNTKTLNRVMFALSFLVDVNHPVFAKEMYLLGKKYIEVDKIRSFISLYFSRVANFKGYGLKFATEYLKNKLPIDDNCRNMLIALDEPELLEYLLKYEKTDENWASVMVRLTRKTFGSLGKDLNINNWKKYIEEVLPD